MWNVNERIEDVYDSAIQQMARILVVTCEDDCSDDDIAQVAREWIQLRNMQEKARQVRGLVKKKQNEFDDFVFDLEARGL